MTAKRKRTSNGHQNYDGFTWSWLANLGGVPLLTVLFFGIGWYFTSGQTLRDHDIAIKQQQLESKTDRESLAAKVESEKTARENVRNEFLAAQRETVLVLGRLDTRLSVSEKQQDTTNRQLEKIGDLLSSLKQTPPHK